jgi:hypothetical protein
MVARPRRQLDVAQLLQLPPHGGFIERHRKLVVQPLDQIDQAPANNAVDRRDRAAFDNLDQRPPLDIIEARWIARRLACRFALRSDPGFSLRIDPATGLSRSAGSGSSG